MRGRVLVLVLLGLLAAPGSALAGTAGADWVWPVAGAREVVAPFAPPTTRYGPGHRGADVAAAVGGPVRAAGAGRVSYAGMLAGRGVVVVVHGELRSTYEPVVASVRVGQRVAAGEVIGALAPKGHCPACLHWGLLRGDVYLDPVQLVSRGPSRLLPVDPALRADAPAGGTDVRDAQVRRASPAVLRPVAEPGFALRAAQVPWATAAVLALLAGLGLLRRPAPPPREPEPMAALAAAPPPAPIPAELVDLSAERSRRRVG